MVSKMKFMIRYRFLLAFLALPIVLASCDSEYSLEGKIINMYGGKQRTNSYEKYGDFFRFLSYVERPKAKDSSGAIQAPLTISPLESVIATREGSISWTGRYETTWEYKLPEDRVVASTMIADEEHNIYAVDNRGFIHAISNKGEKRFEIMLGDPEETIEIYSDLLALKGSFVAATSNGRIMKCNYEGEIDWEYYSNLAPVSNFAADNDNNVYVPLTNNEFGKTDSLVKIGRKGNEVWKIAFPETRLFRTPSVGKENILIAGMKEIKGKRLSILYALSYKGEIKWEKQLTVVPRFISIADDGTIYVVGYNAGVGEAISAVYSFDKDGNLLWDKFFELGVPAPLMISEKVIAFVGKNQESSGCFFLNRVSGHVEKVVDIESEAFVKLLPSVTPDGRITFATIDFFGVVRIDDTEINKMLPY